MSTKPGAQALLGAVLLAVTLWQFTVHRQLTWAGHTQTELVLKTGKELSEVGIYVQAAAFRELTHREARMLTKYIDSQAPEAGVFKIPRR